jgi:hypothetical protein
MDNLPLYLAIGAFMLSCANFFWLLWFVSSSAVDREVNDIILKSLRARIGTLERDISRQQKVFPL